MISYQEEMCKNIQKSGKIAHPDEDFRRASGDCICVICGYEYRKHPQHIPYYYLNVLCNGTVVKL